MDVANYPSAPGRWLRAAGLALLALALSVGWLLLADLAGKGAVRTARTAAAEKAQVAQTLTRTVAGAGGTQHQVTLATPEYFRLTGREAEGQALGAAGSLVFVIYSENHYSGTDDLSAAPPLLRVNGGAIYSPAEVRVMSDSDHHRTTLVRFNRPAALAASQPATVTAPQPGNRNDFGMDDTGMAGPVTANRTAAGDGYLELLVPGLPSRSIGQLRWDQPLSLPGIAAAPALSVMAFLALTAGLFAALSPCLLQMTVYYLSTLAGASAGQVGAAAGGRKVMTTAAGFVAGMVLAYTVGGALAGLAGQYLMKSGALGAWSRPITLAAGTLLIGMGVYSGAVSGAPLLCRLPIGRLRRFMERRGPTGRVATGFVFALGCLQCFGGALFASLLLYVGSLGSPALGALMLFLFSVSVGAMFLAAALAWSRALPLLPRVQRLAPVLSLAAASLMIAFGILMATDHFHLVSGKLIGWLPFLRT